MRSPFRSGLFFLRPTRGTTCCTLVGDFADSRVPPQESVATISVRCPVWTLPFCRPGWSGAEAGCSRRAYCSRSSRLWQTSMLQGVTKYTGVTGTVDLRRAICADLARRKVTIQKYSSRGSRAGTVALTVSDNSNK